MSMSPEQENFKQLRRLLALKRHEQPPPGYFHDFSRQVIARIQAGETAAAQTLWQRLFGRTSRLWEGFEAKPLIAGAFGVGICSLLVIGLVSSERTDSNSISLSVDRQAPQTALATVPTQSIGSSLFERAAAEHVSTGEVFTAPNRSSIFDEIQRPHVQPVSFSTPGPGN
jgi:hypothetical protein